MRRSDTAQARVVVTDPCAVREEANVLDLPCGDCRNATSAVAVTATLGTCAGCLTRRVQEVRERWEDRYRKPEARRHGG